MNESIIKQDDNVTLNALWARYFESRDDGLRDQLIDEYMFLARRIAAHYYAKRVGEQTEFSDYLHYAVVGLIQAIERYNHSEEVKFETYASYRIKGNLLNEIKHVSEKNSYLSYQKTKKKELLAALTQDTEQNDSDSGFERVLEIVLSYAYSVLLENTYEELEYSAASERLFDDGNTELADIRKVLQNIINSMPNNEKMIVRYYYYYELTYTDIAELLGITKGRVAQLHKSALSDIREQYNSIVGMDATY